MRDDEPDYGVDAPGVMRGLTAGGVAGVAAGGLAAAALRHKGLRGAGALAAIGSLVPLGLGLAMRGYARGGKRRVRDWILARHAWRGDETVLDVGAGRGLLAIGAAERLTTGRVIALDCWRAEDLSGNGADALRANCALRGVADRVTIMTGDAAAMPIPDSSVDVVLSLLCLHNIEDADRREAACAEIVRVLRPGGRVLIGDYVKTADYARAFTARSLAVTGPISLVGVARSLMWVVDATKTEKMA